MKPSLALLCKLLTAANLVVTASTIVLVREASASDTPPQALGNPAPEALTQDDLLRQAADGLRSKGWLSKPGYWSSAHPADIGMRVCSGNTYQVLVVAIPPMNGPAEILGADGKPLALDTVAVEGPLVRLVFTPQLSGVVRIRLPGPAPELAGADARLVAAVLYK